MWMFARVFGDGCDLLMLAQAAATGTQEDAKRAGLAMAAVAGVTALDIVNAVGLASAASREG
jgi:hypothetical protein